MNAFYAHASNASPVWPSSSGLLPYNNRFCAHLVFYAFVFVPCFYENILLVVVYISFLFKILSSIYLLFSLILLLVIMSELYERPRRVLTNTVGVCIRLPTELVVKIDSARGDIPRGKFIQRILERDFEFR